ncbi:hypothetical protein ACQP2X_21645 [Actinoplanes sp. CA-131856]
MERIMVATTALTQPDAVFDSPDGVGRGWGQAVDRASGFAGPPADGTPGSLLSGADRARPLTRHDPFG